MGGIGGGGGCSATSSGVLQGEGHGQTLVLMSLSLWSPPSSRQALGKGLEGEEGGEPMDWGVGVSPGQDACPQLPIGERGNENILGLRGHCLMPAEASLSQALF